MKRSVAVLVALIVVVVALWWRHDRPRSSKPRGAVGAELAGGRGRGAAGKPASDDPRALPQATIRGTVRTVGGGPIAGAQVCAHFATDGLASDEWRTPPCATTDAAGAYALEHLLPVRHGVAASAAGHQAREWQNAQGEPDSFVLAPGEVRTVDFALPPGGAEVSGTVEDVSGGPIVGALVAISSGDLENVAATARTDAQGRFSLWSAAGPVRLRAQADGYTPGASAVSAPTARAQLSLTPESSLAGTVVTAGDARPVADAIVAVALDDDDGGEASARSDAQGRFRLTRLVPGRYHPRASGDGYRGDAVASVLLGLGQSVDGIEIVVHPASRVRGTVVIDRGGGKVEPCPRGAVMLTDPASHVRGRDSFELDGAFAILALAPGRYEARVRCNGHAAQRQYPPVEVAAGADVTGLVFTVTPGAVITGTARTTAGAPVAAAWVSARATDAGDVFPGAFARSGDDGVYHLTGLRGGTYELEASARGQTDAEVPAAVTVAPGGVATADVVFPASGAVAGVVVDPAGRQQAGLLVSAGGRWLDAAATTGDDGAFRLDGVEPGQHGVTVSRGRYDPVRRPRAAAGDDRGESVVVVAGQTTTVRLVVEPQDGVITGIVKDGRGEPVVDAWVVAMREPDRPGAAAGAGVRQTRWTWGRTDRPALTGTDGRFAVRGLGPGPHTVRAYRRGGGEAVVEHVATGSDTTLTLLGAGSIAGTVTVASGGAPAAFEVVVTDARTGFERRERFARTDGAFVVRDLPAGAFIVVADSAAGRAQATVPLAADEHRAGVALVLAPKRVVTGRFVDLATGAPVAGVRAHVTPAVGAGAGIPDVGAAGDGRALSGADGRFTVANAPGGLVYVVGLNTDRGARWPLVRWLVELPDGAVADVGDVPMVARRGDDADAPGDFGWTFAQPAPDADPRTRALTLSAVRPGPAAQAGLVAGDTIVTVDGHAVTGLRVDLGWDLLQVPAGTTVSVGLARGGTVSLTAIAGD